MGDGVLRDANLLTQKIRLITLKAKKSDFPHENRIFTKSSEIIFFFFFHLRMLAQRHRNRVTNVPGVMGDRVYGFHTRLCGARCATELERGHVVILPGVTGDTYTACAVCHWAKIIIHRAAHRGI